MLSLKIKEKFTKHQFIYFVEKKELIGWLVKIYLQNMNKCLKSEIFKNVLVIKMKDILKYYTFSCPMSI